MSFREETGVAADAPRIDCGGTRLAVSREGKGPAVVCLHAVGHGGRDFDDFAAAIRDDFEVIRIDWPGQGRSDPDPVPADAARYAELLGMVLERLEVRRPVILGNSIGGAAAILHAARCDVRALVLCDSGGLLPSSQLLRGITALFVRFFRAGERGASWFDRAFAFYYRALVLPAAPAAEQRARIIRAGREVAPVLRAAWQSFGRPESDLRVLAAGLDIPVWCAWAKGDKVVPLWLCRPALRRLKRGRIDVFPGGHAPFLEAPDAFVAGFRRFMAGL